MSNMVSPIVLNKIFFKNYRVVNIVSTIKLFLRTIKLYEAREFASTILKCIVEIDITMKEGGPVWRILQNDSSKAKLSA